MEFCMKLIIFKFDYYNILVALWSYIIYAKSLRTVRKLYFSEKYPYQVKSYAIF